MKSFGGDLHVISTSIGSEQVSVAVLTDNGLQTAPIRRIGADEEGDKFGNEKDDGF